MRYDGSPPRQALAGGETKTREGIQLPQAPIDPNRRPRVLITGGAGFIGSHLCESLLPVSKTVVSVDNYRTGSAGNLDHLLANANFQAVTHDVVEPLDVAFDQVYNLASPASPVHYQRDPIGTLRTNVLGTLTVLGLAERHRAIALQASTSEVYGDPDQHPQTEEY